MSRKFWVLIVALLVLMLALEYQMPRRFVWEPTFSHTDRQPFGCYVFDSMLATTMPHGYTVCRKSLSQLALQDTMPRSIVILSANYQARGVKVDTLLALAQRGCRILYATTTFEGDLCERLGFEYNYYSYFRLQDFKKPNPQLDRIYWVGDTLHYTPTSFSAYSQLIRARLMPNDSASVSYEKLAMLKEEYYINEDTTIVVDKNVAIRYPIGRGELILVATPLMMTNYGILEYPVYVHRLMNRLKDLPVVRTESYMPDTNVTETSPFRELLKRPPLRWALYLILLGVVLMMGFNSRRRQRAIPVEKPPRNYQLDFIRHIGTLQYMKQKKNK